MSNTHGHLPKAERAQLPAELHQRLPHGRRRPIRMTTCS